MNTVLIDRCILNFSHTGIMICLKMIEKRKISHIVTSHCILQNDMTVNIHISIKMENGDLFLKRFCVEILDMNITTDITGIWYECSPHMIICQEKTLALSIPCFKGLGSTNITISHVSRFICITAWTTFRPFSVYSMDDGSRQRFLCLVRGKKK